MNQPVAKAKTSPVRLTVLIVVLLLVIGIPMLLVDVAPAPREVWVQDELGRPVLGAIAQSIDLGLPHPESENIAVSDIKGTLQLTIDSHADYSVTKDGYEPTHFPGSALAVPDAAGPNYSVKNGHFTVTLRQKTSEVQLLDPQKMWQEGVLDPLKTMTLAPDNPPPPNPPPSIPPPANPTP